MPGPAGVGRRGQGRSPPPPLPGCSGSVEVAAGPDTSGSEAFLAGRRGSVRAIFTMASATRSGAITSSHLTRTGRAPNRRACAQACPDRLASNGVTTAEPAQFREAVAAMNATTVRPEIELGPIRPPQRLAPFSYALGAEVRHPETAIVPERSEGDAFGRLILLHDPEGAEAWDGTMRLVAYIQADLDSSEAVDPLLPGGRVELARRRARGAGRTRHRARRHRHRHHVGALRRHLRPAARPPARAAGVVDGDDAGTWPARAGVLRGARACRGPASGRGHRPELPHPRLTDGRLPGGCSEAAETAEPEATPLLAPRDGVPALSVSPAKSPGLQSFWRQATGRSRSMPSGRRASGTPIARIWCRSAARARARC